MCSRRTRPDGIGASGPQYKEFTDKTANGTIRHLKLKTLLARTTSRHEIQIVESHKYGRMLVLDGELQLSQSDERAYHSHLVSSALKAAIAAYGKRINVLILGGGDGFALRRILESDDVASVTLVDHDEEIVGLFSSGELADIFNTWAAFRDPRVKVVYSDATRFVRKCPKDKWHVVLIDLTDDWLKRPSKLLRFVAHFDPGKGAFISMNGGSASTSMKTRTKQMRSAGLRPIAAWTFDMPSYGEPWRCFLCGSITWQEDQQLRRRLSNRNRNWLLGSG